MRIKDLPNGIIVWYGDLVVGVKGMTLKEKYHEFEVFKVGGNPFDYELYEDLLPQDVKETLDKMALEEKNN